MEELGLHLARFWGILIAIMSLGVLVNRKMFEGMKDAKQDYATIFILGIISLIVGALHVAFYNVWEFNHRGLVTLMGWITLVRASLRLFFPDSNKKPIESKSANKVLYPSLLASTALGFYLIAVSFRLVPG